MLLATPHEDAIGGATAYRQMRKLIGSSEFVT
jgi:hypothetical protein